MRKPVQAPHVPFDPGRTMPAALPRSAVRRVPWHRVVGHGGRISPRPGPGPLLQRRRLRAEGVRFRGAAVDLARHGIAR